MVLPSQGFEMDRNLGKMLWMNEWMDWADFWFPWVIYQCEPPWKISAQEAQGFKHFLCKLPNWTESANWCSAQNLNYGTWVFDGNGEDMDRRSSTIYLGFFLTTKMVVPLETAQNAILALNRKMQFPLFNYGQYFYGSSIWSQRISPQVFMDFGYG